MISRTGAVLVALLVVIGLAQPAAGASTPGPVGLPSFIASALSADGKTASMTITWTPPSGATSKTKYQIFRSTDYATMSRPAIAGTYSTKLKATGLKPGTSYFFQVRAVNGTKAGTKSSRVGHTTIIAQGRASGPTYKVLTYNLCSSVPTCNRVPHLWADREAAAVQKITRINADVIAAQEANNLDPADLPSYTQAVSKSSKKLLFKKDRFHLVRSGEINMRADKWAVWAELEDKESSQRVIFTSIHTTSGGDYDAERKLEIVTLIKALKVINPGQQLPMVLAGDFNSHKNRADSMAGPLHDNKFYDAYDLAMNFRRQHYNSYNQPDPKSLAWVTNAMIGKKWGDHVDHMWVDPARTRVIWWRNDESFSGSRLVEPITSDHSPLSFEVQIN